VPTTLPLLAADLVACCSPVAAGVLGDEAAERLARVFKALGDPTRVKLLSLIAAAGDDGACVCDLVEPVRLSQPTVSHHMRQLVDAGLITREQRGKWAYYRLVDGALAAVAGALAPAPDSAAAAGGGHEPDRLRRQLPQRGGAAGLFK
jgi:ArsR family transcriptional regulator